MEPGAQSTPALSALPCCTLAELQPSPVPSLEDWVASDAWLERAVYNAKQQVSSLFAYFRLNKRDDQTVMVMSIKDNFLAAAFPLPRRRDVARSSLAAAAAAPYEAGASGGEDGGSGGEDGAGESEAKVRNRSLSLQTTYLYYGVLLHALRKLYPMTLPPGVNASSRFAKPTVAAGDVPKVSHLLSIPVFHTSLLTVAAMVTRAIADRDPTCLGATPDLFLRIPQAAGFAPNMMALWNAARWYQEAFVSMPLSAAGGGGSGAAGGEGGSSQQAGASEPGQAAAAAGSAAEAQLMPALPGRFVLGRLMRVCEERGVLAEGSTVYCILTEGAAGGYTEGDSALLHVFLQSYARRATATVERMAAVALQQLAAAARAAGEEPHAHHHLLPELAAELMDQVMCTRLELCFNQHVSVLAACCLYSVGKALKLRLPFSAITRAFLTYLPDHPADLFDRQVELQPAGVSAGSGGGGGAGGGAAARALAARAAAAAASVAGGGSAESGGATLERPAVMGDIRAFYNQSFLPAMEGTVRSLVRTRTMGTASIATAGPIPPMPGYPAALTAPAAAEPLPATATADTEAQRDTNAPPADAPTVAAAAQPAAAAAQTASAPAGFAFPALSAGADGAGGEAVVVAQACDAPGLRSVTEVARADETAAAEEGNPGGSAPLGKQQQCSGAHSVASLREWDQGQAEAGTRDGGTQAFGATSAVTRGKAPPPRTTRRTTAMAAGARARPGRPALSVLPDEEEGETAGDDAAGNEEAEAAIGADDGNASAAHNQRYGRPPGATGAAKKAGGPGILRLLRPPPANVVPTADVAADGARSKSTKPKPQDASGLGGAGVVVGDKENLLRVVGAGKKADEYGFEDADGAAAAAATAAGAFTAGSVGGAGGRRRASSYR